MKTTWLSHFARQAFTIKRWDDGDELRDSFRVLWKLGPVASTWSWHLIAMGLNPNIAVFSLLVLSLLVCNSVHLKQDPRHFRLKSTLRWSTSLLCPRFLWWNFRFFHSERKYGRIQIPRVFVTATGRSRHLRGAKKKRERWCDYICRPVVFSRA